MEGIENPLGPAIGPLVLVFCVIPAVLMLAAVLPMVIWRLFVFRKKPPKTFEGDVAYLVRSERERQEELARRRAGSGYGQ